MNNKKITSKIKVSVTLSLLGIFMLLAIGCGANSDGSEKGSTETAENVSSGGAKGRYIETQMTSPEDVKEFGKMVKLTDGKIAFLNKANGQCYTSSDFGKTWEISKKDAIQEVVNDEEITSNCIAKDGAIFYSYIDWAETKLDEVNQQFVYVDAQGNSSQPVFIIENGWVVESVFADNGELYLRSNNADVYLADIAGASAKKIFTLHGTSNYRIEPYGDGIAAMDGENYYCYDSKSGLTEEPDKVLKEFLAKELKENEMSMGFYSGIDKVYTVSKSGLYSHVKGGSVMEELLSGSLSNMSDPTMNVKSLIQNEDGSFLAAFDNGELYSYVYDPDVPAVPERVLNVYGLKDNASVRRAISGFRKENADIYIKYEIGMSGEDSVTENDAITALNTRLLAGEGPDVIILDGMPMESYIEKGLLEDISGLIEEVKKESSYFDNILEAYDTKKGIYSVPFRYYVPLIAGDKQTLVNITDLNSLADQIKAVRSENDKAITAFGTYTLEETLKKLYLSSSPAWMKAGKLDEAGLKEFLTQAKIIYEADQKNLTEEYRNAHERSLTFGVEIGRTEEISRLSIGDQAMSLVTGHQLLAGGYLGDMSDFSNLVSAVNKLGSISYQTLAGQAEQVFVPNGILGMNANTKEKENAELFLKILLSEEVQALDLGDGFPVNKSAYTNFCTNTDPDSTIAVSGDVVDGNMVRIDITWPTAEDCSALQEIIGTLKTPCETDAVIKETVLSSGEAALTGDKSIEECVNEIKQKISLYLAE